MERGKKTSKQPDDSDTLNPLPRVRLRLCLPGALLYQQFFLLTRWLILVHNCNACTESNNRQVFCGERNMDDPSAIGQCTE